ncbi:teichoic acid translocation permease protein TagG [Halolactibacillus miurensis]|uniref:Transport permease protein n=1 Tax=Halolactibacillus miurensis TaxID=306541 RepID=A0A1I6UJV1_9BACI|nr:ABC transporter permease [Halolactibacillus miurensis]GEM05263.1 teichoic acid translocation permease protein TagG [Halolactibacillus miurensis]SFT01557.1 teichoic acid transport system permease protein [Halolactibacillus miurensis]
MKLALEILKEQKKYFYLIRRLSLYELKSNNKSNYLGMAWELINPAIQILIYWLVFGTLMRREPIIISGNEVPFINWLMAGFFVWTLFYQSVIQGSKSIYTRLRMLSKMSFPMSIIPSYVIFSQFYIHLMSMLVTFLIFIIINQSINIYIIQLPYYMFAGLCLMFSISLVMSTLSTIVRDVHMLLNSTLKMFLYLSGVLWPITLLSDYPFLMKVMKLNPVYYLINGYRQSFFGNTWSIISEWKYTLFFWGLVLVIFLIGSRLHMKFRRHFIDFL